MFQTCLTSEIRKAVALPRTWLMAAAAVAVAVVPTPLAARYLRDTQLTHDAVPRSEFDPVAFSTSQLTLSAVILVMLGITIASYEFAGGAERATVLATPRRSLVLAAKLAVAGMVSAAVAVVSVPACVLATNIVLDPPYAVDLSAPVTLRALAGAVVYLVVMTGLAVGLSFAVRSAAVAIAVMLPLMVMVSTIASNVPFEPVRVAAQFLPDLAGSRMMRDYLPESAVLGPLTGGLVLLAWFVGLCALGRTRFVNHDITA